MRERFSSRRMELSFQADPGVPVRALSRVHKKNSELMILCFWGMVGEPLAQGFDLRAGFVTVTCPVVTPDDNYEIVVSSFG